MFTKNDEKDEKGQSLVEVAIALPVLILLVMGILDLGRAYFVYVALSDAAAEGASYAAIYSTNTAQIVNRVADTSNALVVINPDMVGVECPDPSPGEPITVTVRYEYQILTPIMHALIPEGRIMMKARVVQSIINP